MKSVIQKIINSTNLQEQEAWWMLEAITAQVKEKLYVLSEKDLSQQEQQTITMWMQKLIHEKTPLAYLIGFVPFLNLHITVQPPILIPRPETEDWIAQLIQIFQPYKHTIKRILEIGTGSGCIALALAQYFKKAHIIATDINPQALQLAHTNAIKNQMTNIQFLQSDLFLQLNNTQCFDLIVSNPPYIDPATKLPTQVMQWEDKQALFASNQGLKIIFDIIKQSPQFLCKNSTLPYQLIIEHDSNQHTIIKEYAHQHGWTSISKKDLFNHWRSTWFTR